ncbi:MAG: hypothetical protein QXP41_00560 [Candidatus Nitrosocaldus sp.]
MSEGVWDLIWVTINGEDVQARPIKWDGNPVDSLGNDEYGNPIRPILYMTTCPKCAQLVKFHIDEISDNRTVICPTCAGIPVSYSDDNNDNDINSSNDKQGDTNVVNNVQHDPFIDPIAKGIINTDNYIL